MAKQPLALGTAEGYAPCAGGTASSQPYWPRPTPPAASAPYRGPITLPAPGPMPRPAGPITLLPPPQFLGYEQRPSFAPPLPPEVGPSTTPARVADAAGPLSSALSSQWTLHLLPPHPQEIWLQGPRGGQGMKYFCKAMEDMRSLKRVLIARQKMSWIRGVRHAGSPRAAAAAR